MLVLILDETDDEGEATRAPTPLPTCRLDLYKASVRVAIARRAAAATEPSATKDKISRVLAKLAVANHLAQRREFTSEDVRRSLSADEMATWRALEKEPLGLPLTKTLEVGAEHELGIEDADPSKYQFKHLSFQEAFFAEALLQSPSSRLPGAAAAEAGAPNKHAHPISADLAASAQSIWQRGAHRVIASDCF